LKDLKSNFGGVLKELVFNRKLKSLPKDTIQSYLTGLALLKPGYWRIIGITIPKRG